MSTAAGQDSRADSEAGTVYMVHSDTPYKPARHYTGKPATDLEGRLADHAASRGARLTQVQLAAGGSWRLASAGPGTRDRETQLKERGACRRCGVCMAGAEPEAGA